MPGKPAARVSDSTAHGGVIMPPGAPTVLIEGLPAARMNDMHMCPMLNPGTPPPPHVGGQIIATCVSVLIAGQPAARLGDTAICQGPPATIITGAMTVLIGDGGGGGGGGAGGKKDSGAEAEAGEVEESNYLDVKFVDKAGKPITGVNYTVSGQGLKGSKGALTGQIKKKGIKKGDYEVALKGIVKAAWSVGEAKVGERVKLLVETAGIDSGQKAKLEIFIRDAHFADHLLETINSEVSGDKIEEEWELRIDDDFIRDQEDKEKAGGYSSPVFYFRVEAGDVSARSGLLEYRDYIELKLADADGKPLANKKFRIFLANGAIREGTLDGNGYARVDGIPPGRVKISIDPRK